VSPIWEVWRWTVWSRLPTSQRRTTRWSCCERELELELLDDPVVDGMNAGQDTLKAGVCLSSVSPSSSLRIGGLANGAVNLEDIPGKRRAKSAEWVCHRYTAPAWHEAERSRSREESPICGGTPTRHPRSLLSSSTLFFPTAVSASASSTRVTSPWADR
jgi:hypothetical protein